MNPGLSDILFEHKKYFHPVINVDPQKDGVLKMDFTTQNNELLNVDVANTDKFAHYINQKLAYNNCKFGIGGYNEKRTFYSRSKLFDDGSEPRTVHLGIDVWGPVGTEIFAPLSGLVHSFAFNNDFGDYGATIILQHQLDAPQLGTIVFYTLYGHLSISDIVHLRVGKFLNTGEKFAHFGTPGENGNWPPHLHFQIIEDMRNQEGNYPGVCKLSETPWYLQNCPNPDLILNLMRYAKG